MSRRALPFALVALLAGAAQAQAPAKAPAPASTIGGFALTAVAELKAAHDKVASASVALKTKPGGKAAFRLAVVALLAADKARAAGDMLTAKALATETTALADAASRGVAPAIGLDALKARNVKFGAHVNSAHAQVPPTDQLGQNPERWRDVGLAPSSVD